jgi:hypothetical protein
VRPQKRGQIDGFEVEGAKGFAEDRDLIEGRRRPVDHDERLTPDAAETTPRVAPFVERFEAHHHAQAPREALELAEYFSRSHR